MLLWPLMAVLAASPAPADAPAPATLPGVVTAAPALEALAPKVECPTAPPRPCQSKVDLSKNRVLQRGLESALASTGLARYTARHRLAVAVVDLTRADETYYAGVNDDDMLYAASLPKIAILLADAQAAADGRLTWTTDFDRRLSAMITESSNADATWAAGLVGFGGIEQVVRDPRYCLYDDVHGGLWVGRAFAPGGETYPDPLHELVHGATARQTARFYVMLDRRQLVSRDWSDHMLALMGPPRHHHKFVKGLADQSDVTFVARKSGTWQTWHADSALIQHGDTRYVAVALSEGLRRGEDVMQQVIRVVDELVMIGRHRPPHRPPRA